MRVLLCRATLHATTLRRMTFAAHLNATTTAMRLRRDFWRKLAPRRGADSVRRGSAGGLLLRLRPRNAAACEGDAVRRHRLFRAADRRHSRHAAGASASPMTPRCSPPRSSWSPTTSRRATASRPRSSSRKYRRKAERQALRPQDHLAHHLARRDRLKAATPSASG